jgi:hypothetical protein
MTADQSAKNLENQIEHLLHQYAACMPDEVPALAMSIRGAAEAYHELTGKWYVRGHSAVRQPDEPKNPYEGVRVD